MNRNPICRYCYLSGRAWDRYKRATSHHEFNLVVASRWAALHSYISARAARLGIDIPSYL